MSTKTDPTFANACNNFFPLHIQYIKTRSFIMFRFSSIIGAFVATALASSTVSAFAPAMGKSLEDRH